MAKFSIDRFPPGFFDLTQDVARRMPLDLIDRWTHGDRSKESALTLLSPHAVFGSVVASDAAGLTSMSRARGVIEMLALVNHPKEIVHACGTTIGGEAMGVWAADNTQMFYPAVVETEQLLSCLLETMYRIDRECQVRIGMCVHSGCFFRLGGGLYGTSADRVEHLAEESTAGGEIIVTEEFYQSLGRHAFEFEERRDLRHPDGRVWRVLYGPRMPDLGQGDERYPYPFSPEFSSDLRALGSLPDAAGVHAMHDKYMRVQTVVLVEREREEPDVPEIAVLNDLALSAAMTKHAAPLLRATGGKEVKTAGSIGIYAFDKCAAGLEFARRFRTMFKQRGVDMRAGIDRGEVLLFEIEHDLADIAGMPVNLASKLGQDHGEFGSIHLTEAAAAEIDADALERVTFQIAGTGVTAFVDR